MVNTPLTRAPATAMRVLHDTRAVLDVCDIDLFQIGANPAELWIVLRTTPGTHSASATIEGAVIDGNTGRLVDASGAETSLGQPSVVYEGSYEVLTILSGQSPAMAGQYSWREPYPGVTRELSRDHVYNPFASPATVVCRFDPGRVTAPFDQVRVLPEGWEQYVAEAVSASRDPSRATSREWLTSPNSLLFARAVTLLARSRQLDEPLLRSLLDQTHGYRRALLHFVTLRDAEYLGTPVIQAGLSADFAPGSDPDHQRAAGLGLLTAQFFARGAVGGAVTAWALLNRPDASVVVKDPYVRETFALLAPA